ncbi:MAG TPA: UDP-N-acetylmuramate:L-alanyl-gamma-D-glutamyl-meso-diaminopimelate ligase [Gemmatimonadaceae bacterium]|nr:UDP-N-acetylmuramate:L-alanyl-gamma-D-glutamyl-meso-diaminopimelate ligase [Gemmatimonadaceae bacterium]
MAREKGKGRTPALHYHLIGVGGTAMASLAGLLKAAGHRVTGSDENVYPPMSTSLDEMGVAYSNGYRPENLDSRPDIVIVGNAISRGNPELEEVLVRKLRYTSAAATIKEEFIWGRHSLAVAGTHGKTTTTSLLAWALESAGLNPSFLIGGVAENFGTSYRLTDSKYFVIEADEYDTAYFDKGPKMWHYLPDTAIVNNIEFDHADIYRDEEAYKFAFARFINLIPKNGTLVAGWDSPLVRELAPRSFAPVEAFAYGDGTPPPSGHAHWHARDVEFSESGTSFRAFRSNEEWGRIETPLAGAFNVRNVLAVIAAGEAIKADREGIRHGLKTFASVKRRMELKGEVRGVTVIDDFAHHPTAVRETIDAIRQKYAGRRIVAVFEPRSYTAQRREFQNDYVKAFGGADEVVLAALFHPERYDKNTAIDLAQMVTDLSASGKSAKNLKDADAIVKDLAPRLKSRDVVLIMSNGGFGGIHQKLLDALER